jgi:hypothetical protein
MSVLTAPASAVNCDQSVRSWDHQLTTARADTVDGVAPEEGGPDPPGGVADPPELGG